MLGWDWISTKVARVTASVAGQHYVSHETWLFQQISNRASDANLETAINSACELMSDGGESGGGEHNYTKLATIKQSGQTAFHHAIDANNPQALAALLLKFTGTITTITNDAGVTPLEYALKYNFPIAIFLLSLQENQRIDDVPLHLLKPPRDLTLEQLGVLLDAKEQWLASTNVGPHLIAALEAAIKREDAWAVKKLLPFCKSHFDLKDDEGNTLAYRILLKGYSPRFFEKVLPEGFSWLELAGKYDGKSAKEPELFSTILKMAFNRVKILNREARWDELRQLKEAVANMTRTFNNNYARRTGRLYYQRALPNVLCPLSFVTGTVLNPSEIFARTNLDVTDVTNPAIAVFAAGIVFAGLIVNSKVSAQRAQEQFLLLQADALNKLISYMEREGEVDRDAVKEAIALLDALGRDDDFLTKIARQLGSASSAQWCQVGGAINLVETVFIPEGWATRISKLALGLFVVSNVGRQFTDPQASGRNNDTSEAYDVFLKGELQRKALPDGAGLEREPARLQRRG